MIFGWDGPACGEGTAGWKRGLFWTRASTGVSSDYIGVMLREYLLSGRRSSFLLSVAACDDGALTA